MDLQGRKDALVKKIYSIEDEEILHRLEENIAVYEQGNDVTDELSLEQLKDLLEVINEPDDKDILTEAEFKQLFARWGAK